MDGVHLAGEELHAAPQVPLLAQQRLAVQRHLAVLVLERLRGKED